MGAKQEPQNCWEFWNCPEKVREMCLAYKAGTGRDCFIIAHYFCSPLEKGFKDCFACPWYQKLHPREDN